MVIYRIGLIVPNLNPSRAAEALNHHRLVLSSEWGSVKGSFKVIL